MNETVYEMLAATMEAIEANNLDESVARAQKFLTHTIRCGPHTDDRAWVMLRIAVLWYNDQEPVPAAVWVQRALLEGPRADAFALLGEIARMEEDWPLAAKWFEIASTMLCPARCIRQVMEDLPARLEEHKRDLLVRRVEYGMPMDHMFVVMSGPGRNELFEQTMKSLRNTAFGTTMLHHVIDVDGDGQAKTFFRALEQVSEWHSGYLTIFEGDIVGARNLISYIDATIIPSDVAMVSWFHKLAPAQPMRGAYWLVEPAANFSCNQAITMPVATAHALLESAECKNWSEPHGADMLIGKVMPNALVAYHFPNLVQHVGGEQSLVGNTGERTSPTFVGEDVDALSLCDLT